MPSDEKKVLLITFDLPSAAENGEKFEELIKAFSSAESWWHFLTFGWMVLTHESPKEFYARLESIFDGKGDRIFIVQVTTEYWGRLPKEAWEWIRANVGGHTERR
jgi:hypothetical protein